VGVQGAAGDYLRCRISHAAIIRADENNADKIHIETLKHVAAR